MTPHTPFKTKNRSQKLKTKIAKTRDEEQSLTSYQKDFHAKNSQCKNVRRKVIYRNRLENPRGMLKFWPRRTNEKRMNFASCKQRRRVIYENSNVKKRKSFIHRNRGHFGLYTKNYPILACPTVIRDRVKRLQGPHKSKGQPVCTCKQCVNRPSSTWYKNWSNAFNKWSDHLQLSVKTQGTRWKPRQLSAMWP